MWDFSWWYVPIWAMVLIAALSSTIIRSQYFAVIERLGDAIGTTGPGWKLYLVGLYRLTRYPKATIPDEVPADFEKIIRDDKSPVDKASGQARAMWISHVRFDQAIFFHPIPTDDEKRDGRPSLTWSELERTDEARANAIKHDALQQRLTSEPNGPLSWRIRQEDGVKFHVNVGSIENARARLFDEVQSTLQDVCGKMTMGECIRVIDIISEYSERKLKYVVGQLTDPSGMSYGDPWGIEIQNFSIKQFYPGHKLNEMIRDAAGAESKRREKIADGEAEARVIDIKSAADALRREREGKAEASAVKAVAEVMDTDGGKVARAYDVLEVGFKNSNLIVAGEAIGLAKTIQEALSQKKAS